MLNKNNNKNMLIKYLKNNYMLYEHSNKTMFNFVKVTVDEARGGMYVCYSNYFSLLRCCIVNYLLQLLYKSNNTKYYDYEFNSYEYNCYNSNDFLIGISEQLSYNFTLFNTKINDWH